MDADSGLDVLDRVLAESRTDVLGQFLDSVTIRTDMGEAGLTTGDLHSEWRQWLAANIPDVKPGRTGDFVRLLRERGENVDPRSGARLGARERP